MKKLGFLLLATLALGGCHTAEKYAQNNGATAQWLDANAGTPSVNVSGRWQSDDWGDADFRQKGNRVTGILGKYPVGGVVRNDKVFLAITENGWTYYTAVLEANPFTNTLDGNYSEEVPYSREDLNPMSLARVRP